LIPVVQAPEPGDFDEKVRKPGLRAIDEMIGAASDRGKGKKHKKIAEAKEGIPASAFPPYWREALGDLLSGYQRICAYLCLYIPRGVGAPSVDHMTPKSLKLGSCL